MDRLEAELAEAEFSPEKAVSSTLILLDEPFVDSQLEKTLAVSSTVAYHTGDYVSLERARLAAFRFARENPEIYGADYFGIALAWELESELESDDVYYVCLHYRPSGTFLGTPGTEEFIMDKEGNVEFRQILREPNDEPPPPQESPPEETGVVPGGTVTTTTATTTAAN